MLIVQFGINIKKQRIRGAKAQNLIKRGKKTWTDGFVGKALCAEMVSKDLYENTGVGIQNTEEKQYHGYSGSWLLYSHALLCPPRTWGLVGRKGGSRIQGVKCLFSNDFIKDFIILSSPDIFLKS